MQTEKKWIHPTLPFEPYDNAIESPDGECPLPGVQDVGHVASSISLAGETSKETGENFRIFYVLWTSRDDALESPAILVHARGKLIIIYHSD